MEESNLKQFAEYLAGQSQGAAILEDDADLFTRPVFRAPQPLPDPLATALVMYTLRGFAEFVALNIDGAIFDGGAVVHVEKPDRVVLVGHLESYHRRREVTVAAAYDSPVQIIDKWVPVEDAVIGLLATFVDTAERGLVLELLKSVRREDAEVLDDTGTTQQVTARTGVHLAKLAKVPSPIELCPYRTFVEIEQPASLFVVRLREEGSEIKVLLRQADGGAWKVEAARRVGAYLTQLLQGLGCGDAPRVIF
jgi:hypothetical protein